MELSEVGCVDRLDADGYLLAQQRCMGTAIDAELCRTACQPSQW
jgi:hypothetical protein